MKLTALAPKWLEWEGTRVGIVFRCPCCHDKPDGKWLTAFVTPLPQWNSWEELGGHRDRQEPDQHRLPGPRHRGTIGEQEKGHHRVITCSREALWTFEPVDATFENLTVKPSLDASMAGHWHGFITNGETT